MTHLLPPNDGGDSQQQFAVRGEDYRPLAYTPPNALSPLGILSRLAIASSAAFATTAVTSASISPSCFALTPSSFRYSSYSPTGSRLPHDRNSSGGNVSRASRSSCVACPPIRN